MWIIAFLTVLAVPVQAQNQIDLGSSKDNTLFEDVNGTLSNGAGPNFFVGKNNLGQLRRGVIAFDIAGSVPSGVTIDSVGLTLFMSQTSSGPQDIELRRLLADWGEGTSVSSGGQGAPATQNDATWIHTFYDSLFWASPGGDFSITASAVMNIDAVGFYTWGSTSAMVADVQDWLDNPSTNFGWLLIGNEITNQTTKRFETKENTVEANRPVLTVYWSGPSSAGDADGVIPISIELRQNYPNPFNPETRIEFTLNENQHVVLKVYNLMGEEIATLVNGFESVGEKRVSWDGRNDAGVLVPSGLYIYQLHAGNAVGSKKMLFIR
jgi:hypothetical protein